MDEWASLRTDWVALQMDNAAILAAVRREFPKHTWDTFVTEPPSIAQDGRGVKEIRGVLGDSAEELRYIQTLPKLGYRFVARGEVIASAAAAVPSPTTVPSAAPDLTMPRRPETSNPRSVETPPKSLIEKPGIRTDLHSLHTDGLAFF
jgi:hypothetical protein